jgi:hypothetical protein
MKNKILATIIVILGVIGCFALESALAMMLWNWVVVGLFNAAPIDFWLGCGVMFVINFAWLLFAEHN